MHRYTWTAGLIATTLAITTAVAPQLGAQDIPDEFQNLQLLDENISKEELKTIMTGFTEQLGVKCTFCHELGEYQLDDKEHKQVARKMVTLVGHMRENLDLYFSDEVAADEVTCWTCHRGEAEIEGYVPEEEDEDWL